MSQTIVPRVLVLHGYTQNASIFGKRIGALRKTLGKDVDLVIVDAPMLLRPVDMTGTLSAPAPAAADDPKLAPRAWWRTNGARTVLEGLENSLVFLRDVLRAQRFDGVFGFSQGAAMAAVLAALLERPHLFPPFLVDGAPPHPPFAFCVAVSGFAPAGALAGTLFADGYATPTLHVLGQNDVVVVEERSRALVAVSRAARVEEHDGGHFVPSSGAWRAFLKAYMRDPLGDVPGPTTPGTATPEAADEGDAKRARCAVHRI